MDKDLAQIKMTITPNIEKMMKGEPFFLEIEMLQGSRKVLKDGRIKYRIEVADPHKQEIVKEFVLKMISKSHLQNGN